MENFKKDLNTDRTVEVANVILKGFRSVVDEMPEEVTLAEFGVASLLFMNEIENQMLEDTMPFKVPVTWSFEALKEALEVYGKKVEEELGNENK